eukprot:244099-Rhodomonas_salina.1
MSGTDIAYGGSSDSETTSPIDEDDRLNGHSHLPVPITDAVYVSRSPFVPYIATRCLVQP